MVTGRTYSVEAVPCVVELSCPGAFGPYTECVAAMTGCDPEVECADEVAVLEECGLSMSDGMMP